MRNRRDFIKTGLAATVASPVIAGEDKHRSHAAARSANPLPRWRGFNLMAFFTQFADDEQYNNMKISDLDLKWIRDWGFDYIRLPFSYWLFVDGDWRFSRKMNPDHIRRIDEKALSRLDEAVEKCVNYGLHINVNMHRAPGYCINGWDMEPFNLFKDKDALDAFVFYWDMLARRYSGISNKLLSFNLVNEAPNVGDKMSSSDYRRVMKAAKDAIHRISPERTIIIDGTGVGRDVVYNMINENVAQAFHAYDPFRLTHYRANWANGSDTWPVPEYPYPDWDGSLIDRRHLAIQMAPWAELARQGVGVHCGECGCYKFTPHQVFLDWFGDVLYLLRKNDIGWALWNFRGDFGILDSGRRDVDYQDWYGHKLDRKLLDLLLEY